MTTPADPAAKADSQSRVASLDDVARRLAVDRTILRRDGKPVLLSELKAWSAAFRRAHQRFSQHADQKLELPAAAEWLLDNYYLVQQAVRQVRHDLPKGYYRSLPKWEDPSFRALPRIYILARELTACCELHLEPDGIRRFFSAYQTRIPLTIGELWALPTMLRLATLGLLYRALDSMIGLGAPGDRPPAPSSDKIEPTTVADCILNLRSIDIENWKQVFEDLSLVEQTLRRDPARIYARMDFETRDRYRKVVEEMARSAGRSEIAVAETAIDLAADGARGVAESHRTAPGGQSKSHLRSVHPAVWIRKRADPGPDGNRTEAGAETTLFIVRASHVGFYLLDQGRPALEDRLKYHPAAGVRIRRRFELRALRLYLGAIGGLSLLILAGMTGLAALWGASLFLLLAAFLAVLVPALTIAVSLVHTAIPRLVRPHILPKMDFHDGIPAECATLVAVPALISSVEEIGTLLRQLEQHYLSTLDENLYFALLTDFPDAPREHMSGDEALLSQTRDGILELNRKYGTGARIPFHLLHRDRKWNPSEGVWMGWERKRGKLVELSRLLSGETESSYRLAGAGDSLPAIRYVITLDADSLLTRGGARNLIATFAHPLNQAEFDIDTGVLVAGYTVLQPRVRVAPVNVNRTVFTRLYAGDPGLDLYTLAVSDVYQDLFQEGSFVGKGIMDVAAFHRCLSGRVPENALLSHDLFEGILGRAGLVTDVVVLESFPVHYLAFTERLHRWIRGDWQLLPWLFSQVPEEGGGLIPNDLSALDRWKILDNLRRSLLAPSMLALFLAGWFFLPGPPIVWTLLGVLAPGVAILAGLALQFRLRWPGFSIADRLRPLAMDLARWILALAFLPYEAFLAVDAIVTTLIRLTVTRRRLLQWIAAAHIARFFRIRMPQQVVWRRMAFSPLIALATAGLLVLVHPAALPAAGPLLLAWLFSPQIAHWISLPLQYRQSPLTDSQKRELRELARRTWLFYESFVGPEDNWLPPDHFQESPRGQAVHHTSPTNIGFLLLSCLAAGDLGFMGPFGLVLRLTSTLDTLEKLDRHRGHFLNWYNTRTLAPLTPAYVSTVDSGNLAGCLITLSQACLTLPDQPVVRWQRWQGLLDTLALLREILARLEDKAKTGSVLSELAGIERQILAVETVPFQWAGLLESLTGNELPRLDALLMRLINLRPQVISPEELEDMRRWSERFRHHLMSMRRETGLLAPWLLLLENRPAALAESDGDAELQAAWRSLVDALPAEPALGKVPAICRSGEARLESLTRLLDSRAQAAAGGLEAGKRLHAAQAWCARLASALSSARLRAESLLIGHRNLADRSEALVSAMDFAFLFDPRRQVFHIGYNLDAGRLDDNHYDLLASEARLASLVAIAKRDVPLSHWLHLGRPLIKVDGSLALLSWSGTMFEYLMPMLLMRTYPETLLDQSCRAAVTRQQKYALRRDVPWGISESGYYAFDAGLHYQYRAFGVPGLGLKRGLEDDLVVSPYASILALPFAAAEVIRNAARFRRLGMLGAFGFYEALDCTPARMPAGQSHARIRSYMAHHHGMILVSLANALQEAAMVRRFHSDPRIRTVDLLLQERLPVGALIAEAPPAVAASSRFARARISLASWSEPVEAVSPRVHVLSNGRYSVMITSAGSGYSQWQGLALTRWTPDSTLDDSGMWIYLKDRDTGRVWSTTFQPLAVSSDGLQAVFSPYKAEFRRQEDGLALRMEVTVAAEEDVEIRNLILTNHSDRVRRLDVASYGEVVLATPESDRRHPAFQKMFIESEFLPEWNAQLFRRRPRSAAEEPVFLAHLLVGGITTGRPVASSESDRAVFLGRGRTPRMPESLTRPEPSRPGAAGATLDPILSLRCPLDLAPRARARLVFLTLAGRTRAEVLDRIRRYQSPLVIDRAFGQARSAAEREFRGDAFSASDLESFDRLLAMLLYPGGHLRAAPDILASNTRSQHGLWGFGISGDLPILLVCLKDDEQLPLARDVLRAHASWRRRGIKVDAVILVEKESGYGQELQGELYRLMVRLGSDLWQNQPGGIFLLNSDQMAAGDRTLLKSAARAVLDGSRGTLAEQAVALPAQPNRLPFFSPTLGDPHDAEPTPDLPRPAGLLSDNGLGGFSPDGREYQIYLGSGNHTPKPWINVVANPRAGFTVSEAGAGCTWAENSSENRLTPWSNDPVSDPPGEVLYLRDEETAVVWSPTPQPAPGPAPYLVRHGAGYTVFEHQSHGLRQQVRLFLAPDSPVKVVALRLENLWRRQRRLTATFYAQWVLGNSPAETAPHLVPEYESDVHALLVRNPYSADFPGRCAFLAASDRPHGLTADRLEFLGRMGDVRRPAALARVGLAGAVRAGLDPCAAIQLHVELRAGESREVFFLLGEGTSREEALALIRRFGDLPAMEAAWQATRGGWDDLLDTVRVQTPDPEMDLVLNRWLIYQALSCRVWGRTALYQSGGAFGFRDQLQDALALLHAAPQRTREMILLAAQHQFREGDVMHWWHPPSGRGIRTRCSDDLLWLPFVAAQYVEASGDSSVLDERVPFLEGAPLGPDESERYGLYERATETGTLWEHCRRALQKGSTAGANGLPLIGSGDWNDGFNQVGAGGRGESVWLGWFLYDTLNRFAALGERIGRGEDAPEYRRRMGSLRAALETNAWDGHWYRRATFDDGEWLGSAKDPEWSIDSVAQSWAVLSGAADPERARQAMREVRDRLVRPADGLIRLAAPPFDRSARDPGYIKGYPPGVRENGGAYQHAATWVAWACARLGWAEDAHALFRIINPVCRAASPDAVDRYQVEPYAVAADLSGQESHPGQGGWTWYTGSAGWLYRLGLEGILGLRRVGDSLKIDPCIPGTWPGFEIRYRYGSATYQLEVKNPAGVSQGVAEIKLDGVVLPDGRIPLVDDGAGHLVQIRMG